VDDLTTLSLLKQLQDQVGQVQKLKGPRGLQGDKGNTGSQGAVGPAGSRGLPGADGPVGPQGADGANGIDGTNGVGVESVYMAADGEVVFTLTDGSEYSVELPDGLTGASEGGYTYYHKNSFNPDVLLEHTEDIFYTQSLIDQGPTLLDTVHQITFGAPASNEFFSISAAGELTCLLAGDYKVRLKISVGRTGDSSHSSQVYLRGLINGVQATNSVLTVIDSPKIEIPQLYERIIPLNVNDVATFEIIRDSSGDNSGSLLVGLPTVTGWGPSPSALINVSRSYITTKT
tara:strand:+ start:4923 stop:5786 length:864 start_codon:yes stop_codon:yes gene_type:complete